MKTVFAMVIIALVAGCERPADYPPTNTGIQLLDDGPLYYSFREFGANEYWGDQTLDSCWFADTRKEFVLVAQSADDGQVFGRSRDCSVQEPYQRGYVTLNLTPLRELGSESVQGDFLAVALTNVVDALPSIPVKGDQFLVSLRVADSTPFVIQMVPITVSSAGPVVGQTGEFDLPTSWLDLTAELESDRVSRASNCQTPESEGYGGTRNMSDQEFADFMTTPEPKPWCEPDAASTEDEEPTGPVTDIGG